jgi:elongator complex protein 3
MVPNKKVTRTISGVTPVAVMTQPNGCPGKCIYCPTYPATPQSYTPESPAVFRARTCNYNTGEQINLRLDVLADMGHPTNKVELIIMGGTFLATPVEYQYRFIKECYDALNGTESSTLDEAKKINEDVKHRCTGLCIETRPDWCGPVEIERMLEFGATRVELGVQTLDDTVYSLIKRGHTVADVVQATYLLRQHGFKVYYHMMPGLPGNNPEKDLEQFRLLFDDSRFKPDGLKIYPTVVVEGTELEKWFNEGRYKPYDTATMTDLTVKIKKTLPKYVRIARVLRDIPPKFIVAGCIDSLRGIVKERMKEQNIQCRCIRCREYGHRARAGWKIGTPELIRFDYDASDGKEIFLSFEDKEETLFGLLRLRIQQGSIPAQKENNTKMAIIRELHVFGPEVPLNMRNPGTAQHRGLGKALLNEAENIVYNEFKIAQIFILSGVGAKEYYRGEGYHSEGEYMTKELRTQMIH